MKKIISYAFILISMIFMDSCKKLDFDYETTGEAIGAFKLINPADNSAVLLNSAAPATPVVFSWSAASKGVNAAVTYSWKIALKTGDLKAPLFQLASDNAGAATTLTLTHKSLDSLLEKAGIAANAKAALKWTVVATNSTKTEQEANPFNIDITRFGIGITAFTIFAPASSTTITNTNPSSTTDFFNFRWQKAIAAPAGNTVRYKVAIVQKTFDANGNALAPDFSRPLFTIASNSNGVDTFANVSYKQMSDSLSAHGLSNLSIPSLLQWTVIATSGTFSSQANYFNDLYIAREVKVYVVGAATPGGWDIALSTRMIEDPRFPGTYFTYIQLTAGEFKFVNGQAWPPSPGAVDWGQDPALPAGNITDNNENNISVATAGVYRITFDLVNKKYYLQTAVANGIGGMGMIGAFQGWSQPATKMGYIGVNKFLLLANMNTNDEFKFHDGNDWNNSANNLHRWFAVDNNNGGKMVIDPGAGYDNFKWTGANGRVRAIWDGSNTTNLTYSLTPATEMRVVGNGVNVAGVNDWDPPTSPQMTYTGNGIWTITLPLRAAKEIKFVSGNAWGAFDYEDGGNGKLQYDGGPNFATPAAAGTYTITLNEQSGTYSIL
ncbi:MAG: SusF/SusE family outer membrane protein [Ferruginibacter sp.]|nr:SusF/SusE family outer membrane protein [Ferruginibacter sp.]